MQDKTIKITFKAKESEREELQVLAARARMNQSEFIRTLISDYGETLVQRKRLNASGDSTSTLNGAILSGQVRLMNE